MAKKRNPQDSTLRNVRAINKHVIKLERTIAKLTDRVNTLWWNASRAQRRRRP